MNGLPFQCLNGVDDDKQSREILEFATRGYNNEVANDMDTVSQGLDFSGFRGDGSIEDDEKIYNHLLRTKKIVDSAPNSIMGYQQPENFSKMLGYVLGYWDTPDRESAIEEMASEESRLIGIGAINMDIAQDGDGYRMLTSDDIYDSENYTVNGLGAVKPIRKNIGFFNQLKQLSTAPVANSQAARAMVAANPFFDKYKGNIRRKIAKSRRNLRKKVVEDDGVQKIISTKEAKINSVNGLGGYENEDLQAAISGRDIFAFGGLGSVRDDLTAEKAYLMRTRNALLQNPELHFDSAEEMDETLGMLDYAIQSWDNDTMRDRVLGSLSGLGMTDDQYDEFLEGLAGRRKKKTKKKFFKNLKDFSQTKNGRIVKAIVTGNPFALINSKSKKGRVLKSVVTGNPFALINSKSKKGRVLKSVVTGNPMALVNSPLNGDDVDVVNFNYAALLSGIDLQESLSGTTDGTTAVKNYLRRTRDVISADPEAFCEDGYDYENTMGVLGYAIQNWDNKKAVDALCGVGMTDEQYEDMEDMLGALGAKKSRSQKKAEKARKKEAKNKEKAINTAEKTAYKLKQKTLKKQSKELKNKIKSAGTKAEKKKLRKEKNKVFFKRVKNTANYAGKKVGKAFKKVWKAIVKYNPVSLLIRGGLMLCFQLNMFKLSTKLYPGTASESDAMKLGLTKDEYVKAHKGWLKVEKIFTKLGGDSSKLFMSIRKGYKRAWKKGEKYDKSVLKTAVDSNEKELQALVNSYESELKAKGAVITNDPNVTVSTENVQVEVEVNDASDAAFAAVNGLIDNHYLDGLGGLGEVAVAATTASAGGVIASIIAFLSKMGINADWLSRMKNKITAKQEQKTRQKAVESSMSDSEKAEYDKMDSSEQEAYVDMTDEERASYQNASGADKDVMLQTKVAENNEAKQAEKADQKAARQEVWNNITNKVKTTAANILTNGSDAYNNIQPLDNDGGGVNQNGSGVPKSSSDNGKKIALIVAGVALLGVGSYLFFKNNKNTETQQNQA